MAAVDDAVQTRVHERLFGSLAILSETHLKVGLLDHVAVLVFMITRRRHTVSHSGRAVPVLPTASRLTTSSPTPVVLLFCFDSGHGNGPKVVSRSSDVQLPNS